MPFFDFYFFKNFVVNYFYFKTFLNLLFKYIGIKKSAFKSMLVISFKTLKDINRETLLKVYKLYPIIKNRAIIDNDNRVVLEDYQYMQKPYRSICRILISFNELSGVEYQGTGFLVGPHTILTNCHMVYDCSNEHNYGWFDSISISFGTYEDSNGKIINPYGTITQFSSASCGSFRDTKDRNDDWALIDLNENIGNELGYFGVTSELSNDDSVTVVGYSGDLDRKMAYSNGNVSNVNTYKFDHNCDTTGGVSGSPVIKKSNNLICGIHSGYSYYWFFGNHYTNHACKISTYIVAWIEERL